MPIRNKLSLSTKNNPEGNLEWLSNLRYLWEYGLGTGIENGNKEENSLDINCPCLSV